jgi:antirestriction protein ArdC
MRKQRKQLTDEERAERREKERELVKASVEALRSSEGWQAWLESRSRFHKYSLGNQLLIAVQGAMMVEKGWITAPPRRVAGFKKWLELGYAVRKRPETVPEGAWGIKIWAPIPPGKAAKAAYEAAVKAGERPDRLRTFFRLAAVFGDTQVDPLPEMEQVPIRPPLVEVEGDSLAAAWEPLVVLAGEIGYDVALEDTRPAGGYMREADRHIAVNEHASVNQRCRTLVHELAHALVREDRQEDDPKLEYAEEELVAESVAMSVSGVLSLDTASYSVPYLASWAEKADLEVLEATAKLINRLANRIEDALPEELVSE